MKKLACSLLVFTVACGTSDDDYKSQVTQFELDRYLPNI